MVGSDVFPILNCFVFRGRHSFVLGHRSTLSRYNIGTLVRLALALELLGSRSSGIGWPSHRAGLVISQGFGVKTYS